MTDTATRLAALDVDELLAMHERIDTHGPADSAIVEAHHLVTTEILRRGLEHGHDGDAWASAAVEIDSVSVDGPDDIDAPEGMEKAWSSILADGGTVSVVLTVDGYVLKADPSVGDVHVDTIMGGGKRKKRLPWPLVNDEPLVKADGHPVPDDVQAAARQALKWIADGRAGDGFTSVGRGRARQLADGGTVDTGTLVKMRAYFARHIVDKDAEGWGDRSNPTPGMVAWYAWGGDAGRAWANRILGAVEKAYDPETALTDRQRALYEAYEAVAEMHGEFDNDEAHYMAPEDNPFKADGMKCANCVFFEGGGGCEILSEQVDPDALCKFWVISDNLLKSVDDDPTEEDFLRALDDADKDWYGQIGTVLEAGGDPDLLLTKAGGNPEALRDYWRGGGKGKISWGAGGDFTSCVAAVGKYMTSEQAKGYCAIRHREVTGMWPGDKRNRMKKEAPSGVSVLTLPDGATYTINAPIDMVAPVEKHGNHDQKTHAGRRGGAAEPKTERGGRAEGGKRVPVGGSGLTDVSRTYSPEMQRLVDSKPRQILFAPDPSRPDKVEKITQGKDSLWQHTIPDGKGGYVLTPERRAVHDKIIAESLAGVPKNVDNPTFVMMGGGGGSGKGTLLGSGLLDDAMPGGGMAEGKHVRIDADEIKMALPEYDTLARGGRKTEVAGYVHEESSILAKRLQSEGIKQGSHVVLDGTGDSSADSLTRKITEPREAGYRVVGEYVTAPVRTGSRENPGAWERNIERAADGPRGLVPASALLEAHTSVSRLVPDMAGEFDSFRLWDTGGGRGNETVIATATRGGSIRVQDRTRYQSFLDKGRTDLTPDEMMADITSNDWTRIREAV